MNDPTSDNFTYNREYAPIFFAEPTAEETRLWTKNIRNVTREYYNRSRKSGENMHYSIPLPFGITFGEMAMMIITSKHAKRNNH